MLLETSEFMCPFKSVFLYPLGKYLVVQLLDHRVVLFLTFRNLQIVLQSGLHSHQECKRVYLFTLEKDREHEQEEGQKKKRESTDLGCIRKKNWQDLVTN